MIKVNKVVLTGFKSFRKRTVVPFFDGMTAIIGENGSGKSNLFDAISFVMGRRSSQLRSDRMEHLIFNGGGRPIFGTLTDRLNPRNTAMLSFVLIGGASLAMWQLPSAAVYIVAFALLWGCLGGWLAIAPTATAGFFGTCDYPRCYGIVFLAYGAGAIAGPQLAGFIKTTTGDYLGVFPFVAAFAALGLAVAFLLLRPVQPE